MAVAYCACALIWGTTWFAIRVCIGAGGYSTYDGLALRFAIASLVLVPIAAFARPWPTGRTWAYLVLAGVLDAGGYMLVYLGEERVPGAVAAVVYGTQPLILAAFLVATRMEKIERHHVVGALVSLAGVGVLFADRLAVSAQQAVGIAMVIASVAVSTAYSMVMKQHGGRVHGVVATTIFLGVTAIILGAIALAIGAPIPWPPPVAPTIALLYLALVGSVVAFLSYFWLLDQTSMLLTSTLVFVYPLVALVADALFERDRAMRLGARSYLGVAIILGGLVVSLRARSRDRARAIKT